MTSATFSTSLEAQQAAALMEGYRFELGGHDARQWVSLWLEFYRPSWIRDAVVEALYQGRYKSVSVRQILELWNRRSQPIRHVTYEFEAAVCREFGEIKVAPTPPAVPVQHRSIRIQEGRTQEPRSPAADFSSVTTANGSAHSSHNGGQMAANGHRKPVSFDLATLPPTPPGIAAALSAPTAAEPAAGQVPNSKDALPSNKIGSKHKIDTKTLDHKAWREFSAYTTPTHAGAATPAEPADLDAADLHAQRQFNGVLYASARAIQPFKPALPFSAQTLRLAKQKAIAQP